MKETSDLIQAYRNFNCLWDPEHADYKDRTMRQDALTELALMVGVAIPEIKRKLAIIHSQYRRERRNYKEYRKSGAIANFKSKWFGYNLMSFLHDINKRRTSVESDSALHVSVTKCYHYKYVQCLKICHNKQSVKCLSSTYMYVDEKYILYFNS